MGTNILKLEGYGECHATYRENEDQWVIKILPETKRCYPKLVKFLFNELKNMGMIHTIVIGRRYNQPYVVAWKSHLGEDE
tara:strand:+ start:761 stop:1000 length:240 start_codon:yes stop_codon:yes gene_type:complete